MRFNGGEMVLHRLEIRYKATNVAESESKNIRGSVKTPKFVSKWRSDLGTFVVHYPDGDSEAGCCCEAILKLLV